MDKNHVYTAEEIHKCIDGYILQNSIWDEFNKNPMFFVKSACPVDKTSTEFTFTNGQRFKVTVEEL